MARETWPSVCSSEGSVTVRTAMRQPKVGERSQMRRFVADFVATLPAELREWVDVAVYTANRPWRTLDQRGAGKLAYFRPVAGYGDGTDGQHYVQARQDLQELPLLLPATAMTTTAAVAAAAPERERERRSERASEETSELQARPWRAVRQR